MGNCGFLLKRVGFSRKVQCVWKPHEHIDKVCFYGFGYYFTIFIYFFRVCVQVCVFACVYKYLLQFCWGPED